MGCGSSVSRQAEPKAAYVRTLSQSSGGPPTAAPVGSSLEPPRQPEAPVLAQASGPSSEAQGPNDMASPLQRQLSPKPGSSRNAPSASSTSTPSLTELPETIPETEAQERARTLTSILAQRLQQHQQEQQRIEEEERQTRRTQPSFSSLRSVSSVTGNSSRRHPSERLGSNGVTGGLPATGAGSLAAELQSLIGAKESFQELLNDLMYMTPAQILLPEEGVNLEDAATLQTISGCTMDQALRLLECLTVVCAAADALRPTVNDSAQAVAAPKSVEKAKVDAGGKIAGVMGTEASAAPFGGGPVNCPSPQQLTRQLGTLAGLVNDVPGLRTVAMARETADPLLRILVLHPERAAAANAALVLSALAAGPPAHKTSLITVGVVDGLLQAARGRTAAAEAAGGDAPVVAANACSALGNLATGHAAGAAALAAATGGIDTLIGLIATDNAPNVRTNAAGVIVQMAGAHEACRAAVVAAGGVPALAAGMLRGPEAPACNAVTALYNLAALTPPTLRPAMAQAGGELAIVPQLLLCIAGRNAKGAGDESVAAASSARINASAVLLELCKDPVAAPLMADASLAVLAALAALATGRLPPPPPAVAAARAAGAAAATPPDSPDILAHGVDILYPVPSIARGNCLLGIMALARMGPSMQLELGRCGALATLLQLLEPGQDPAMQINSANAICSLAACNADIHAALVASHCVPLLAGLLGKGGDAARANVAAVLVTMMRDPEARVQIRECGALTSLVRLAAALLDERLSAGTTGGGGGGGNASTDSLGALCNSVGALAEAGKHLDLRRSLLQVEFGEVLGTLLRCLREGPEPAQVNAAAALCHLCREQPAAVQLGRLRGVELLKEAVGARPDSDGVASSVGSWTRPSSRLRHNASRALARLQEQLSAVDEEAQAAAVARAAAGRVSAAMTTSALAEPSASGDMEEAALLTGGAAERGGDGQAEGKAAGSSHRWVPPRAAWDLSDTDAMVTAAAATSSRTLDELSSYDEDDVDNLSMVITPPLPLAAF